MDQFLPPKTETSKFHYHLLTLSMPLLFAMVVALTCVLLLDFMLWDIPEPLNGFHELGKLTYAVSLSYVAAFVFYVVVVYIPKTKNEMELAFLFTGMLLLVGRTARLHTVEMREKLKLPGSDEFLTPEEMQTIMDVAFSNGDGQTIGNALLLGEVSGTIGTIASTTEILFSFPKFHDIYPQFCMYVSILKGQKNVFDTSTDPIVKSSRTTTYMAVMQTAQALENSLGKHRQLITALEWDDMLKVQMQVCRTFAPTRH